MINPNNKYLNHLGLMAYIATIVLTTILFIYSLFMGGITIDESTAPRMVAMHLAVAANNITLEQVPNDFIYYGIVNIIPGYLISSLLAHYYINTHSIMLPNNMSESMINITFGNYYICSHISIFLMGLLTSYLVYKILKLCKINSNIAYLSSALLLLYPSWLGHSFFNFKDIPTAFFYTLYSYYICTTINAMHSSSRKIPYIKLIISGALFAAIKLALFPLVIIYTCIIVISTKIISSASSRIHIDTPNKTKLKNIAKKSKPMKNKLNPLAFQNQAPINLNHSSSKFAFNRLLSVYHIKFISVIL
nr:hypothetical protein [Burkholderiales bacterium]